MKPSKIYKNCGNEVSDTLRNGLYSADRKLLSIESRSPGSELPDDQKQCDISHVKNKSYVPGDYPKDIRSSKRIYQPSPTSYMPGSRTGMYSTLTTNPLDSAASNGKNYANRSRPIYKELSDDEHPQAQEEKHNAIIQEGGQDQEIYSVMRPARGRSYITDTATTAASAEKPLLKKGQISKNGKISKNKQPNLEGESSYMSSRTPHFLEGSTSAPATAHLTETIVEDPEA